ncbi:hypothetical protein [Nocardioides litoris]|uniref:hypothetical protein n=1 Tax=Nocardioides litoris TaxID=1926648 RepID=UPI0011218B8A|nr:hypothetical protein [Nocardioides litoris]
MLRFLFILAVFALATYLLVRVFQQRGVMPQPRPRQRPEPRRIVAPDDDEDFLRDLDRKRREPEDPAD